jgi:hypothetical protein
VEEPPPGEGPEPPRQPQVSFLLALCSGAHSRGGQLQHWVTTTQGFSGSQRSI